jgi:hypothetical protein
MNIVNKKEKFKITVSSTSIHRLLKNIETIITALNSQPRIQNFMAVKLTSGIPRDEAAIISGTQFEKLIESEAALSNFRSSQRSRSQGNFYSRINLKSNVLIVWFVFQSNQLLVIESLQKN